MYIERKNAGSTLVIGAKRGRWRTESGVESADREFALEKPKVLARDQNKCVSCGVSMPGLHVHHRNDDHSDNRRANLETACDLCHAVHHVGLLGKSGAIAYLSIPQEDLSHLFRTMAVAVQFGGDIAKKALALQALLMTRFTAPVDEMFGTHNPADFGNALLALYDDDYARRSVPLSNVRVIFDVERLGEFGARARKGVFDNNPPSLWPNIYRNYVPDAT